MLEKADYLRVGKRGGVCAKCGASLEEADRHPSVLREEFDATDIAPEVEQPVPQEQQHPVKEEQAPFSRYDYCPKCWAELKDSAYFSFWIGRRIEEDLPPKKLNRAERNMALAALFDSLKERNDEETDYTPHLYFIAHLLMKYKIFKWQPSQADSATGQTMLRFIPTNEPDAEEIHIPEIHMPDEMILKIKEEIEAYLLESTGQEIKL